MGTAKVCIRYLYRIAICVKSFEGEKFCGFMKTVKILPQTMMFHNISKSVP